MNWHILFLYGVICACCRYKVRAEVLDKSEDFNINLELKTSQESVLKTNCQPCQSFYYPSLGLFGHYFIRYPNYYWRDYTGTIPKDALPGGYDIDKKPTYIAQVLHKNLLIPAEIRDGIAYYEWGFQQYNTTYNVKIFCTKHPKRFQWVITTKDDFKTLTDKDFITGGYEPNFRIYIGRKLVNDTMVIGKVQIILPNFEAVFHYPWDGRGLFDYSFEILTYLSNN